MSTNTPHYLKILNINAILAHDLLKPQDKMLKMNVLNDYSPKTCLIRNRSAHKLTITNLDNIINYYIGTSWYSQWRHHISYLIGFSTEKFLYVIW